MAVENQVEQAHQQYLPTAFLSAVIHDCMENGRDVVCGGAHYNFSGIQMIQVADLADSLAAVKELVYDTGMISRAELMASLETDFEGHVKAFLIDIRAGLQQRQRFRHFLRFAAAQG